MVCIRSFLERTNSLEVVKMKYLVYYRRFVKNIELDFWEECENYQLRKLLNDNNVAVQYIIPANYSSEEIEALKEEASRWLIHQEYVHDMLADAR